AMPRATLDESGAHGPEALPHPSAASSVEGWNMDHDSFFVHIDAAATAVGKNRRFPVRARRRCRRPQSAVLKTCP
ncbi:MAG: hypothetical protein ACK56I_11345, partial [bacterium]